MMSTSIAGKFPITRAEIPPRVLVIDDEPLVRWSLTAGLQLAGFDAIAIGDASDARRVAAQLPGPRVDLLDVRLWGTDPRALLEDIRRVSPQCRFLILAVAGQDVTLPPWDGIQVIRKPFDLHDVIWLVEAAVQCPAHTDRLAG